MSAILLCFKLLKMYKTSPTEFATKKYYQALEKNQWILVSTCFLYLTDYTLSMRCDCRPSRSRFRKFCEFGHQVTRGFLMQGNYTFSPGDNWQCLESCVGSHKEGARGCYQPMPARGQVCCHYPVMHKTVPTTENDLAKSVNSAKTEKL